MVFDYYHRLKKSEKAIYDRSDSIGAIRLPNARACQNTLIAIRNALASEDRTATERASSALCQNICQQLKAPRPRVKVLARRPSDDWGELHGLYEPVEDNSLGIITVWMRTAARKQVVAPRSFVRTVLHELCHHLDYEHFALDDSYHTQGFYKRESSLFKQLNKDDAIPSATAKSKPANSTAAPSASVEPETDAERARKLQVTKRGKFPQELKQIIAKD